MKAIETTYRGYRFRSRLEARWAVFFTEVGLKWEYEPEGFRLPSGQMYLPDFCVRSINGSRIWYEIKPLGTRRDQKFDEFIQGSEFCGRAQEWRLGVLLDGDPLDWYERAVSSPAGRFDPQGGICPRCGRLERRFEYGIAWPTNRAGRIDDTGDVFVGCQWCDYDTPCGSGNDADIGVVPPYLECEPYKGSLLVSSGEYLQLMENVKRAAAAARQARFEHGQVGAPSEWRFA